ncbi:MAG: hypothetical protein ACMUIE_10230 [Thermoplasmatota archaeon]
MRSVHMVLISLLFIIVATSSLVSAADIDEAIPITNGTYRGEVWTGSGPNGSYWDVFRISLDTDQRLTIRAKLLGGEGPIEIQSFDSTPYPVIPGIYIKLQGAGSSKEDSFVNDNMNVMVLYIEVWGEGNYELEVSIEDAELFDPFLIIIIVFIIVIAVTLLSFMFPMGMMLLAVLVILFLIRRSDKKRDRNRPKIKTKRKGPKVKRREGRTR